MTVKRQPTKLYLTVLAVVVLYGMLIISTPYVKMWWYTYLPYIRTRLQPCDIDGLDEYCLPMLSRACAALETTPGLETVLHDNCVQTNSNLDDNDFADCFKRYYPLLSDEVMFMVMKSFLSTPFRKIGDNCKETWCAPYIGVHNLTAMCRMNDKLLNNARIYTYDLPRHLWHAGNCDTYNRGYQVESYFITQMQNSPLSTNLMEEANIFLVPVTPCQSRYSTMTVINSKYMFSDAIEFVKRHSNSSLSSLFWANHVYVSSHDQGASMAEKSDIDFYAQARGLVNTADKILRFPFRAAHDVQTVFSISFDLPLRARDVYAHDPVGSLKRNFTFSFVGRIHDFIPTRVLLKRFFENQPDGIFHKEVIHPDDYIDSMVKAKFCLCPRGTRGWSPRIIESILFGCIPIILADNSLLPLSSVLDWSMFSLLVPQDDIPSLLTRLRSLSSSHIQTLQRNLKSVVPFFVYHQQAIPGDAFYTAILELYIRISRLENPDRRVDIQ